MTLDPFLCQHSNVKALRWRYFHLNLISQYVDQDKCDLISAISYLPLMTYFSDLFENESVLFLIY